MSSASPLYGVRRSRARRVAGCALALALCTGLPARASPLDIPLAFGPSAAMPAKSDIEAVAARVGDHYLATVPCGAEGCAINNKWDNGVLMMGVIDHWSKYGTAAYRSYAETWAAHNDWSLFTDTSGRDQENPNWHNRLTAGYTYLRLFQAGTPGASIAEVVGDLDAQLALPISPEREGIVDYVFPGSSKGSLSWKIVDANFMALPVWIAMGGQTGQTDYYDRVRDLQDYQVGVMGLQDPMTKLWFQREAVKTMTTPNGLPVVWGRGNGWIAAGLASALTELPSARGEYEIYRTRFTDLMRALRTRQRADGFWSMNVADPDDGPGPEASATALITFALARGIRLGILDRATYGPVAARAWNAMVGSAIANDGHLGFCQPTGRRPLAPGSPGYPGEGSADVNFCAGALLLAGTAMNDIAPTAGPRAARIFQAETLTTAISAGDSQRDVANAYAGGGRANLATLSHAGDFVQYQTGAVANGTYELRIRLRLSPTGAIWQLKTNGRNTGGPVDTYDASAHYAELTFGMVTYASGSGPVRYRFVVRGRNPASTGYDIEVDRIRLFATAAGGSPVARLLDGGVVTATPSAPLPAAGGTAHAAPVPLPASAGLLAAGLAALGLIGPWRRWRRVG